MLELLLRGRVCFYINWKRFKWLARLRGRPSADIGTERSECQEAAPNDRLKTRPAVCIEFCYQLKLRKGRLPENTNTLKMLHFLNAPF